MGDGMQEPVVSVGFLIALHHLLTKSMAALRSVQ